MAGAGKTAASVGKATLDAGKPVIAVGKLVVGAGKPVAFVGKPVAGAGKPGVSARTENAGAGTDDARAGAGANASGIVAAGVGAGFGQTPTGRAWPPKCVTTLSPNDDGAPDPTGRKRSADRETPMPPGRETHLSMKTPGNISILRAAVLTVGVLSSTLPLYGAAFTPGDLVVDQVGNGSAALTSASTAVVLDEFQISGLAVQSIALATDGTSVTQSGTATSEGFLHFTADGKSLVVPGYNVASGVASISGTTATADPRGIAEFSLGGTQTSVTQLTGAFSGNNIRGAAGVNSTTLLASGATGGIYTAAAGTNGAATVTTTNVNNRDVNVFGGNIYFDTGTGTTARGLFELTGTSTAGSQTATQVLATGSSSSPYEFSVSSDNLTAFIADSGGTLTKYTRTSATGTFAVAYTTTIATGVTGLAVSYGATDTVYFDSPTTLFSVADNGTAFQTINTLDTAAANTAFRGLDIVPTAVPEPATWAAGLMGALMLGGTLARRGLRLPGVRRA